jgi:hypothetical protein
MQPVGVLVRFQAKPDRGDQVEAFMHLQGVGPCGWRRLAVLV